MQQIILPELVQLKKETDFVINNRDIIENKDIENYLRNLEKIRWDIFSKLKINNKNKIEDEKIDYINNNYKATLRNEILRIYIPETLPKYKNISNYAYKNIMISTAECIKDYKGLFDEELTFVVIIIHEKQANMDIDNKYVKPVIDALVLQGIIKDDNINNMLYLAQGKNDTNRPYTEEFVMSGKYISEWIEKIEKFF